MKVDTLPLGFGESPFSPSEYCDSRLLTTRFLGRSGLDAEAPLLFLPRSVAAFLRGVAFAFSV
jgi:hypothetical protein